MATVFQETEGYEQAGFAMPGSHFGVVESYALLFAKPDVRLRFRGHQDENSETDNGRG